MLRHQIISYLSRFGIDALIHIPDHCKPGSFLRIEMLTEGMDHTILPADQSPIDHIIPVPVLRKMYRGFGDPGHIIRVGMHIHVIVHQTICLFPVLVAEQV